MNKLLEFILLVIVGTLVGMFHVYVVSTMWGWFITPQFGINVPPFWMLFGLLLTLSVATLSIGIGRIYSLLTSHHSPEERWVENRAVVWYNLSTSAALLGMGWVIHLLV